LISLNDCTNNEVTLNPTQYILDSI